MDETLHYKRFKKMMAADGLGSRLVRSVFGSAWLRLGSALLGFGTGVLLARALGPSGYGIYGLVVSITALLTVPTEFGLPSLVTREVAAAEVLEDWSRMRGILGWTNKTVAAISLLLFAATMGVALLFKDRHQDAEFLSTLAWALLLIPLVALGNLRGATLRALRLVVRGQLPEMILRPGMFLLLLCVVQYGFGWALHPAQAMLLNVIAAAFAFLVGAGMLLKAIPAQCRTAKPVTSPRTWVRSALPLALTEGTRMLQGHVSVLLIGAMLLSADVGLFRVASQIAILLAMPLSLFDVVLSPLISRFHAADDRIRLQRMLSYGAATMFFTELVLFVFLLLFGRSLLTTFFGPAFGNSYLSLIILAFGQLLNAYFGSNAVLLNMSNGERAVARAFLMALVINILLSVGLIHVFGIIGAAIANTAGLLLWNILLWQRALKTLKLDSSVFSLRKFIGTGHD